MLLTQLTCQRSFGVGLNQPCTAKFPGDSLNFKGGNYSDLLIALSYQILTEKDEGLEPIRGLFLRYAADITRWLYRAVANHFASFPFPLSPFLLRGPSIMIFLLCAGGETLYSYCLLLPPPGMVYPSSMLSNVAPYVRGISNTSAYYLGTMLASVLKPRTLALLPRAMNVIEHLLHYVMYSLEYHFEGHAALMYQLVLHEEALRRFAGLEALPPLPRVKQSQLANLTPAVAAGAKEGGSEEEGKHKAEDGGKKSEGASEREGEQGDANGGSEESSKQGEGGEAGAAAAGSSEGRPAAPAATAGSATASTPESRRLQAKYQQLVSSWELRAQVFPSWKANLPLNFAIAALDVSGSDVWSWVWFHNIDDVMYIDMLILLLLTSVVAGDAFTAALAFPCLR